jgi:Zn finger protein HypA/HybF involved in hydrogenase expression
MTTGRHPCTKSKSSPTYSAQWSGVSYAPTAKGKRCINCGKHVHKEGDSYYCPYCDNYVKTYDIN